MSADETQFTISDTLERKASRRDFIKTSALSALATTALAACAKGSVAGSDTGSNAAGTASAPPSVKTGRQLADEMDKMHEAGVKAFPAKSVGMGNQILTPVMDGGVKVFKLTSKVIQWETAAGQSVEAWAYNEQVPGPQIRVRQGDRVRVVLKNELPESTVIHFHGLEVPNDQDGVPFITQPPVKPGTSFTYEFVVPNSGSHMYHSHHNSAKQVGLGLLGAFIVEPRQPLAIERADVDQVLILNDGAHGYTFNGKSFPATQPIVAKLGQKVRIRFMNEGLMIHPMHLHGMHMTAITKDGWPLPAPFRCDTLNVAPGERWDVIVNCTNKGTWAFHCHILIHAESSNGMFGMVTALVVT